MDWLVAWGVSSCANFIFKDVLLKLASEGLEDYAKDFFKESAGKFVGLAKQEPIKIAFGQAQKQFLEKIQQELEDADLLDEEIGDYTHMLADFVGEKSVLAVLGQPVEKQLGISSDNSDLNLVVLVETWNYLVDNHSDYQVLPDDFNWEKVGKRYVRSVNRLVAESDELRELLNAENLRQIKETLEKQAPILPDFDLHKYQENLQTAYRRLDLDALAISGWENPMKLWDIFTPQNVTSYSDRALDSSFNGVNSSNGLSPHSSSISVLDLINNSQTYKYTVLIGNPGAGKSTLTRYKVMQWTKEEIVTLPTKELPILIELRNYIKNYQDNKCNNFLEYLQYGSGIKGGNLNQHELNKWLKNNKSMVMFDGLDEVIDPATRANIVTDIINFKDTYSQARIVITSRIIGYKQQQGKLENAGFNTFLLEDFDARQIDDFIDKWHKYAFNNATKRELKRDRLKKSIRNSPAFQELAGNPLLLTMMAILNRHEESPRDRATLYERASEILLYKWEADKYLPFDQKEDLEVRAYLNDSNTYKDKIAMLRLVAHRIQHDGVVINNSLVIDEDDLEEILIGYLSTKIDSKARFVARAFIKDITERSFILCFLGDGKYGFIHKTFLEYFCASHIVHLFEKKKTLTIEAIQQEYFITRYEDEAWHEILVLIVNILDEIWVLKLLQCVMDKDGVTCQYKNLFLVANCLRDIRNIRNLRFINAQLSTKLETIVANSANVSIEVHNRATKALNNIQSLS